MCWDVATLGKEEGAMAAARALATNGFVYFSRRDEGQVLPEGAYGWDGGGLV